MLTPKNILVVRADRMGDVVLTVPAIRALKHAFPKARVSVWLDASTKPLLDGLSFVDEILVEDKGRGWIGYFSFVFGLWRRKFDLVVVYNTKRRTNMACALAGIPHRLGYKNEKYGGLLTHPVEDRRHLGEKHEAEYCLDLLRQIGVESKDVALEVSLNKDAEQWADDFAAKEFQGKHFVAVHASASCSTRFWPVRSYVDLIDRLAGAGMGIILVGGKDAQGSAKEIAADARTPVLDMTGKTSLPQLVSLLRRTRALVSNDSGPVHVAAAAGTPVVSIFLRSQPGINPERWKPLGPRSRVVLPQQGEEIVVDRHSHVIRGSFDSITPEQVFKAIQEVF
jgi:lipopolysaccharide heptosyltransferase II